MYIVTLQSKINQQIISRCICQEDYELAELLEERTNSNLIAIVEWVDTYKVFLANEDRNKK